MADSGASGEEIVKAMREALEASGASQGEMAEAWWDWQRNHWGAAEEASRRCQERVYLQAQLNTQLWPKINQGMASWYYFKRLNSNSGCIGFAHFWIANHRLKPFFLLVI